MPSEFNIPTVLYSQRYVVRCYMFYSTKNYCL